MVCGAAESTEDDGGSMVADSNRDSGDGLASRTEAPKTGLAPLRQCQGARKAGGPCRAPATVDGRWCPHHAPGTTPELRSQWASRGAAVANHRKLAAKLAHAQLTEDEQKALLDIPDLSSADGCRAYIERLVAEVKAGLLPPSLANSINGLIATRLKVAELELSAQLAALEAEVRGRS